MAPALTYITVTSQDHCNLNTTWASFSQDPLVSAPLIAILILDLSSSNSSCPKIFPVLFSSCPSFEAWFRSRILYKALPDTCTQRLKFLSEHRSHPRRVLPIWHLVLPQIIRERTHWQNCKSHWGRNFLYHIWFPQSQSTKDLSKTGP